MTSTRIALLATGGTIASHFDGTAWANLDGAHLLAELGDLSAEAHVAVRDVESGPSSHLSVHDMLAIISHVRDAVNSGVDGVVVTHGTDTLEITSFLAGLILDTDTPVVFTGSMRVNSHAEPDGPGNMRDSIALAASPQARGRGVLVCLNGEIHSPRLARKLNASGVEAFYSIPDGAVGRIHKGVVEFAAAAARGSVLDWPTYVRDDVHLVTLYPGLDEAALRRSVGDSRGVVVEAFGDLNVPMNLWGVIHEWSTEGRLVVIASGAYTPTATSEFLDLLGIMGAGGLTPQKARVALLVAMSDDRSANEAKSLFRSMTGSGGET